MKPHRLLAAAAAAALTGPAVADALLTVDLRVTAQVTITAISDVSNADVTGPDKTGVYFEDFYGGPGNTPATLSTVVGNLTTPGNASDDSPALYRPGAGAGLDLYGLTDDFAVSFTTGSAAFTASAAYALDPEEYADIVAGGSRSGRHWFAADNIDNIHSAPQIGEYTVVASEPGSPALFPLLGLLPLLGLCGLGALCLLPRWRS